jgi:hypothetical protein
VRVLPRKLTFQLTPLLDLLLIVIFAQYMEVQKTSQQTEAIASERVQETERELQATAASLDALRAERIDKLKALSSSERQIAELITRIEELGNQNEQLEEELGEQLTELKQELQRAISQRNLIGDLVVEFLGASEESVETTLKNHTRPNAPRTQQDIVKLREQFQALAAARGREVVRHLLTFEELRKRCDIWELYITETGLVLFTVGETTQEFRADTPEEFESEVFERYKSMPQPKGLVVILFSYGDAKALVRETALKGLPHATDRMRADSNGRTRFEYANLGYDPKRSEP